MSRRRARQYALQMLFQYEFTASSTFPALPADSDQDTARDWPADYSAEPEQVRSFADELFQGTLRHRDEIDAVIRNAAEHWDLDRMVAVDRNILRLAAYEILYRQDIPAAVTIDEALEIAKKFSTQESASFINGLLDRIAKTAKKT